MSLQSTFPLTVDMATPGVFKHTECRVQDNYYFFFLWEFKIDFVLCPGGSKTFDEILNVLLQEVQMMRLFSSRYGLNFCLFRLYIYLLYISLHVVLACFYIYSMSSEYRYTFTTYTQIQVVDLLLLHSVSSRDIFGALKIFLDIKKI
jgi:hypothetical protein